MEHGYPLLLLPSATLVAALVLGALAIVASRRGSSVDQQHLATWAPWLALIGIGTAWLGSAQAVLALGSRPDALAVQTVETRLGTRHLWMGLDAAADGATALACLLVTSIALTVVLDVVARSTFSNREVVSMTSVALTSAGALGLLTFRSVPVVIVAFVVMGIGARLGRAARLPVTYEQIARDRLADLAFLASFAVLAPSLPSVDLRTLQAAALPGEISILLATLETPLGALPRSELAAALLLVAVLARTELMGGDGRGSESSLVPLRQRALVWLAPHAVAAINVVALIFFMQRVEGLWILAPNVQVLAALVGVMALAVGAARLGAARLGSTGRIGTTTHALLGLHVAGAVLALGFADFTTAAALVTCGVIACSVFALAWQPSVELSLDDRWSSAVADHGLRQRRILSALALAIACGPAPLPGGWAWAMLGVTAWTSMSLAVPWIHGLGVLAISVAVATMAGVTGRAVLDASASSRVEAKLATAERTTIARTDESRAALSWAWLLIAAPLAYALTPLHAMQSMERTFSSLESSTAKLALNATGDLAVGPGPALQDSLKTIVGPHAAMLTVLGVLAVVAMAAGYARAQRASAPRAWYFVVDDRWFALHRARAEVWLALSRSIRDGAEGYVAVEAHRSTLWGFDSLTERMRRVGTGVRGPMIGVWIAVCLILGWLYFKPSVSRLTPDGLFGFGGLTPGLRGVDDPGQRRKAQRTREREAAGREADNGATILTPTGMERRSAEGADSPPQPQPASAAALQGSDQ